MEKQILNKPEIKKRLKSDFLFIPLTVDDRRLLADEKHISLAEDCKYYGSSSDIIRIGDINVHLQIYCSQSGSQPYFYAFNASSELNDIG